MIGGAVAAVLGPAAVTSTPQSLGGEDFAWYLHQVPGAMARLGTRTPGALAGGDLHQPTFDIDERAIGSGRPRAGVAGVQRDGSPERSRRVRPRRVTEQAVSERQDGAAPADVQVFRSPAAVAIWWVWVLFAVANLIDLAVQGRDHLALTAAFILLLVTGIVYVTAQRPRVVAGRGGLTVVNPVTEHRIGWAAVAAAEPTDLLRVRCEWPEAGETRQRAIYAWAVHSSRRRELDGRAAGPAPGPPGAGGGRSGLFGGGSAVARREFRRGRLRQFRRPGAGRPPGTEPDALRLDAGRVVAVLTERAEQARQDAPDDAPAGARRPRPGTGPRSPGRWCPALALLAVALA